MPCFLRSWTGQDAGSDREISQVIYPEYREEASHPAWFPAQQLGAPKEYSSRYVAVETERDQACCLCHPMGTQDPALSL